MAAKQISKSSEEGYHGEIQMAGIYLGGVLGGLVFGAFGDISHSEINSMAWYVGGVLIGAVGGFIAATIFRKVVLGGDTLEG